MIKFVLLNGETIFINISLIEAIVPQVDGATLILTSGKVYRTFEGANVLNTRIFGYQRILNMPPENINLNDNPSSSVSDQSGTVVQLFPEATKKSR